MSGVDTDVVLKMCASKHSKIPGLNNVSDDCEEVDENSAEFLMLSLSTESSINLKKKNSKN